MTFGLGDFKVTEKKRNIYIYLDEYGSNTIKYENVAWWAIVDHQLKIEYNPATSPSLGPIFDVAVIPEGNYCRFEVTWEEE